jgi:hypothetical protein
MAQGDHSRGGNERRRIHVSVGLVPFVKML